MTKKSYLEQMQEITAENLFDGFLGYGLFSEKIPPFLTSESFLNFSKTAKELIFEKNDKGYIQYENIRNINLLGMIPRGLPRLCLCL